jgi:hypothetical protein
MPFITPTALIVATDAALLLHVPPVSVSYNVVVAPWQMVLVPVMADGSGWMTAGTVTKQ